MQTEPVYSQNMGTQPLISFIITDYNLPTYLLKECLDSIFRLTLTEQECEVLLIDDGSDQCPLSDLASYQDRIIYVRQRNKGLSAARNLGLSMAKGRFVQFVDGDDYLIQTAYEHCLDIVRYHQTDVVLFELTSNPNHSVEFSSQGPVAGNEYLRHHNLKASACGYIFRKSMLINLRFHEGILHEDEEFTPQLLLRAEYVYHTSAEAYYYRKRTGSITHNKGKRWKLKRLNDAFQVLGTLNDKLDRLPADDRMALQRRVDQLTMDYIYSVIMLTRNASYLEKCLMRLKRIGLFPLPERSYTKKYKLFSKMVNSRIGRKVLLRTLPFIKP